LRGIFFAERKKTQKLEPTKIWCHKVAIKSYNPVLNIKLLNIIGGYYYLSTHLWNPSLLTVKIIKPLGINIIISFLQNRIAQREVGYILPIL